MGMYCNLLCQPDLCVCVCERERERERETEKVLPNEVIRLYCVRDGVCVVLVHYSTSIIISHWKSQQALVP